MDFLVYFILLFNVPFAVLTAVLSLREKRNPMRMMFAGCLIALAVGTASAVFAHMIPQLYLAGISYYAAGLAVLFFYLFSYLFPEEGGTVPARAILELLPLAAVLMGAPAFGAIEQVALLFRHQIDALGQVPLAWCAFVFGIYFAVATGRLLIKSQTMTGGAKLRLQYFFAGLCVALISLGIFDLVLPLLAVSELLLIGPVAVTAFLFLLWYIMSQARLIDIRLIIAKLISFALLVFVGALCYLLLFRVGIAGALNERYSDIALNAALVLFICVVVLTPVFAKKIEDYILKWVYGTRADPFALVVDIAHITGTSLDMGYMLHAIPQKLIQALGISKSALLLVDEDRIVRSGLIGYDSALERETGLMQLFRQFSHGRKAYLYDELEGTPLFETFQRLDIVAAVAIRVRGNKTALLIVGPKHSGEVYYLHDVGLLDAVAEEIGVALEASKMFVRLEDVSVHLEDLVVERTKKLEATQQQQIEEAKKVARLKDEFVFVAAHELRTPITAVRGFLDIVSDKIESLPPDVRDALSNIALASEHLSQLINDLLEVARSDAGAMRIEASPVDLGNIITALVKELEPLARKKKVTMEMHLDPGAPPVLADAMKAREAIMNLLSNAIKYNREGGRIHISTIPVGGSLVVEFRDTGFGIPPEQQEQIFQKFFRAQTRETREILGTGLGLFLTRMLIEKMGGEVMFNSVIGEGSTFAFSLPTSPAASSHA